ncbi:unnamed protein product [Mycena citricolor]|uniref:RGS domain-containing protein n=1 Tax=Mycena citricolor TaxID=2018698 RepID=A0AAD2JYH8_9AGAR|nr:unnamed protein product [Mycena citricolor]
MLVPIVMNDPRAGDSTHMPFDSLPTSPMTEDEASSFSFAHSPELTHSAPVHAPSYADLIERKLTIRVPAEYLPLSPPPSAELPAVPRGVPPAVATAASMSASHPHPGTTSPKRHSLTPGVQSLIQRRRESAPVHLLSASWVNGAGSGLAPSATSQAITVMPTNLELQTADQQATPVSHPLQFQQQVPSEPALEVEPPAAIIPEEEDDPADRTDSGYASGETRAVNTAASAGLPPPPLPSSNPTSSAIHLPTAAAHQALSHDILLPESPRHAPTAPDVQSPTQKHFHELNRPRRKSNAGQHTPNDLLAPPPMPCQKLRKSPSIQGSPVNVSVIDFESTDEEEMGGEEEKSKDKEEDVDEDVDEDEDDEDDNHQLEFRRGQQDGRFASEESDRDLTRWAPEPDVPLLPLGQPQFPNQQHPGSSPSHTSLATSASARSGDPNYTSRRQQMKHHTLLGLSSMPTELIERDVDYSMRALMDREMFARILKDPLARQRYREFLAAADGPSGTAELDFWTDSSYLVQNMDKLYADGAAFKELYLSNLSESQVNLNPESRRELLSALQRVSAVNVSLASSQAEILESLYQDGFQRYVKHQIIQETHVTLGKANLASSDSEGLGDTFVLTNPRLPDHPIVLVSDGFMAITGYSKAQIIGRNCRFLQGPGTAPASVQRIRNGLNNGTGCSELLLNYRRNGEPFYCLLCIIPVRDIQGSIIYFIGGQTNVTGLLANERGLGLQTTTDSQSQTPIEMSPNLASFRDYGVVASSPTSQHAAAGSVATTANKPGTAGFFKGLFGHSHRAAAGKSVIAGAEATLNGPGVHGLHDQYAIFQNTYNKVMIVKLKKREVIFVSPQMLSFLGLPSRSPRDVNSSPLIRADVASLITAGEDRNETRHMREDVKDAIRRGVPLSLRCAIKVPNKGLLPRSTDISRHKFGMMHMTPIKDADNSAVAFVVIFG